MDLSKLILEIPPESPDDKKKRIEAEKEFYRQERERLEKMARDPIKDIIEQIRPTLEKIHDPYEEMLRLEKQQFEKTMRERMDALNYKFRKEHLDWEYKQAMIKLANKSDNESSPVQGVKECLPTLSGLFDDIFYIYPKFKKHLPIFLDKKIIEINENNLIRAEPISALYEHGRVKHRIPFYDLENEYCTYDGKEVTASPNRLDAAVFAIAELSGNNGGSVTAVPTWGV
jgi:hypothetical protein